jgi:excisionase family DNA binding protein
MSITRRLALESGEVNHAAGTLSRGSLHILEKLASGDVTTCQRLTRCYAPFDGSNVSGRLLLTKSEAAEQLGVSVRTIERLIAAGELPLHYDRRRASPTAGARC